MPKNNSVKSIKKQTGWKRTNNREEMLQDPSVLLKITEYNYNLKYSNFVKYFEDRTGIELNLNDNNTFFLLTSDNKTMQTWLKNSEEFKYLNGEVVPFEKREDHIIYMKILKGKLQACWELWQNRFVQLSLFKWMENHEKFL